MGSTADGNVRQQMRDLGVLEIVTIRRLLLRSLLVLLRFLTQVYERKRSTHMITTSTGRDQHGCHRRGSVLSHASRRSHEDVFATLATSVSSNVSERWLMGAMKCLLRLIAFCCEHGLLTREEVYDESGYKDIELILVDKDDGVGDVNDGDGDALMDTDRNVKLNSRRIVGECITLGVQIGRSVEVIRKYDMRHLTQEDEWTCADVLVLLSHLRIERRMDGTVLQLCKHILGAFSFVLFCAHRVLNCIQYTYRKFSFL